MDKKYTFYNKPELWGGIECTINRVGDVFRDQLDQSGHYHRHSDIRRFAELGIRVLRYPLLWERHQPARDSAINWDWAARQLDTMDSFGISAIAGLVHHGSGPAFTGLLDPDFPSLLADYAYRVAKRFPALERYTPVNEPLTTARFSGLYGHWYPHHTTDASFARMMIQQLKGTVLAMEAIRSVNAGAQLVQTEDLGKTHSTPGLSAQAAFENDRRWLGFDMLCGKFLPDHPLWDYFLRAGIPENDLLFFGRHNVSPDLLGLNYYVTSERWLDEAIKNYPAETHGGNGIQQYADTEVVRANPAIRSGLKTLAGEVWDRYRLPMAVTEAHLHCTREEQMRWFAEIWKDAGALRAAGMPIEGVTAWSLLGAYDWNSLLTRQAGDYEPGVFSINPKSGSVRKTALARLIAGLANEEHQRHPLLEVNGWWHGPQNLDNISCQKLLLVGETGPLSEALIQACYQRGIPHRHQSTGLTATEMEEDAAISAIGRYWGIISFQPDVEADGYQLDCSGSLFVRTGAILSENRVADQSLDLLIDGESGLWELSAQGPTLISENCFRKHIPAQEEVLG